MKTFDLKKFRKTHTELNQEEFAEKVKCSQTYISKIENGAKLITESLIKTIGEVFNVSVAEYLPAIEKANKTSLSGMPEKHHSLQFDSAELERRYLRLLEEKIKMDDRYFELTEKFAAQETSLLQENNRLLKEIASDNKKILSRLKQLEK